MNREPRFLPVAAPILFLVAFTLALHIDTAKTNTKNSSTSDRQLLSLGFASLPTHTESDAEARDSSTDSFALPLVDSLVGAERDTEAKEISASPHAKAEPRHHVRIPLLVECGDPIHAGAAHSGDAQGRGFQGQLGMRERSFPAPA